MTKALRSSAWQESFQPLKYLSFYINFAVMKRIIFLFTALIISTSMPAQQKDLAGEYYLRGVMETGLGFKLGADSTFHLFFSYGGLDRESKGTWKV